MATYFEILCVLAVVIFAFYSYLTKDFNLWKGQGVLGPKPLPGFGTVKDIIFGKIGAPVYAMNLYNEYKNELMIGFFEGLTPVLIIKCPELIRDVLITDFSTFSDRGTPVMEKVDPLSQHIARLEFKRWRVLRARLSPVFTVRKLKEMFSIIVECSDYLENSLDKLVAKGEPIECRELSSQYTIDVIGSCVFGIEVNSMGEERTEFLRMSRKIFAVDVNNFIRLQLQEIVPNLYNLLGYVLPEKDITKYFRGLFLDTIKYRRKHNIIREDFIDVLMELQDHPEKAEGIELTTDLILSQAFAFFFAGYETSSTTINNVLYALAQNHEMQNRLREEIRNEYEQSDGNLTYDRVQKMKYLDKVFREALRMYPPLGIVTRKAMNDYTFKGTQVTIPKGVVVWVPIFAIHRDPEIYPNPEVFDPERFNENAAATRHPMHFLPFGDGPKICIGAQFAIYQTKIGLIKILRNHKIDICEKTQIPYDINPKTFILSPIGGMYLKITRIKN